MPEVVVQTITINVIFDPSKITTPEGPITLDGPFTIIQPPPPAPSRKQLSIAQGITMIVFKLAPAAPGDPQPQFPAYPIEWFDGDGNTIAQPDCFDVHWYNPNQCTVLDSNSALVANPHVFNVVVAYNNKTYGSDPTIVNEPPMPVG
ncbi:MAG TPA: hypothetical protein VH988_20775 [Thermoanaerobaculia bacterium]|jgi:hypothetical protein|nr:hypothetical protein [Thermoanaerobaculia bacterium]